MAQDSTAGIGEIRLHMLNTILWWLVPITGITAALAIIAEWLNSNYWLVVIYIFSFAGVVLVSARQSLPNSFRAALPIVILSALVVSELFFFGATALSYVLMYTLVLFTGLLYGLRASLLTLALIALTIVLEWINRYDLEASNSLISIFLSDDFLELVVRITVFFSCAVIAMIATNLMLTRLTNTLDEKENLIAELKTQIAAKEQVQQDLSVSQDQLAALFERFPDAVFLVDVKGCRLLQVNEAAVELTGLERSMLESMRVDALADGLCDQLSISNKAGGDPTSSLGLGECRFIQSDGHERIAQTLTISLTDNLAFIVASDVTEQRKIEEQFMHSQKMEAVGQLAGGIAHDFNNSLQAIIGFGEIAQSKIENEKVKEDISQLLEAAEQARRLVSQLLVFSRKQVLRKQSINVKTAIESNLSLMGRLIGDHISLSFNTDSDDLTISVDTSQFDQILVNLCVNSRDAIDELGSIKISASLATFSKTDILKKAWARAGEYVCIVVEDNGKGMSEEVQCHIFEPFYTTKEIGKGTGLGLSTVFGIVKQHSGFIHCVSTQETGTRMKVYLPKVTPIQVSEPHEQKQVRGGEETVLLADDDDMVREVTEAMLKLGGYKVMTASTGDEAIEVFDSNASEISLVILDVVMPNISGRSVHKHITDTYPNIPVLFASGYSKDVVHTDFVLNDGINLIQKPFRHADLLQRVRSLLDSI